MATEEIVKVTSKGQFTIPADIRRELRLDDGSYVYVKAIGKIIVMRKVDDIDLREITAILEEIAKDKGWNRAILQKEAERVRRELWKGRYGKTDSSS
jgi:AbrB family looped-hinge helix DNA binding protein